MSEKDKPDQAPFHERVAAGEYLVFFNGKKLSGEEVREQLSSRFNYISAPIAYHNVTRSEGHSIILTSKEVEKHDNNIGSATASKIIGNMEVGGPITSLTILSKMESGLAALPEEYHDDYNIYWNTTEYTQSLSELKNRLNELVLEPISKHDK